MTVKTPLGREKTRDVVKLRNRLTGLVAGFIIRQFGKTPDKSVAWRT